jgi:hypothetical protein
MSTDVEDLVVRRLVPPRVESSHSRAQVGAGLVSSRLGRDVLGDSVVDPVDRLDKVLVHLEVQLRDGRVRLGQRQNLGDDGETKMPNKATGRKHKSLRLDENLEVRTCRRVLRTRA